MTPVPSLLALRFNRRIVAGAVIANGAVAFRDSRYFRGPLEHAEATVIAKGRRSLHCRGSSPTWRASAHGLAS